MLWPLRTNATKGLVNHSRLLGKHLWPCSDAGGTAKSSDAVCRPSRVHDHDLCVTRANTWRVVRCVEPRVCGATRHTDQFAASGATRVVSPPACALLTWQDIDAAGRHQFRCRSKLLKTGLYQVFLQSPHQHCWRHRRMVAQRRTQDCAKYVANRLTRLPFSLRSFGSVLQLCVRWCFPRQELHAVV